MESVIAFFSSPIALTIGFVSSVIGILVFFGSWFNRRKVRVYKGGLNADFVRFINKNNGSVFKLCINLSEQESVELASWAGGERPEEVLFFSIPHDEVGTEVGFFNRDPEIHWNTRFWDRVHTEGFFKVHSTQGPYQGWMSMTLKGVGHEHISS